MTSVFNLRYSVIPKTVLLGLLPFFCQASLASDELVGSDGGSISVGNSGQAVWSMPVEVPSGINGVAPNLTLSVSTSGGNGSLGVGGGLSGLSSISRCGRTIYQDGFFQAPQYKQDDAYCLDGARLVLESGSYGANGSIYRTEIETFQRVKAHGGVAGKGPAYFEVTNRAGSKLIYGQSPGTTDIDTASGAVAVWKIDQLIDSDTNTLHYHYADVSGNGEVQLTNVTYGGNTSQGVAENLSVELVYEDRPDTSSTWSRGEQYSQTKRISEINTKVGEIVVTNYKLSYEQGSVTGASRLVSLQQCAGNGDCYRPSVFEYAAETQNDWVSSALSLPAPLQTNNGKPLGTLTDINNDGKSDWVSASTSAGGESSLTTYLGSGTGWQVSTDFKLPDVLFDYSQSSDGFLKGLLLDVNGDGWPDYVQAYETSVGQVLQTWRNTGTDFIRDQSLDLPVALSSLEADGTVKQLADVADLNADGLIDIVQSIVTVNGAVRTTWIQSAVFNEANNTNSHSWGVNSNYTAPSIGTDYTQGGAGSQGRVLATLFDVNADGLSDWVQSYKVDGVTLNATWLNSGQGFESVVSSEYSVPQTIALFNYDLTADGVAEYTFTDLNGDGLPDLSKAITIDGNNAFDSWVHTGLTWQQDVDYNLPASTMLVESNGNVASVGGLIDLNSDGQPDFVRSYSDATTTVEGFWVFDQSTKEWSLSEEYDLPFVNNRILSDGTSIGVAEVADINHDGYPELLNALSGEVYETNQTVEHPGTLVRTVNSLGAFTELTYGITTDSTIYELAEQTAYPNIAYNSPVRVVKTISASNGIGGMISAHHSYGKAKTNLLGQGGLGYEYHGLKDGNTEVEIVTTFHQTYPYAGRVKASAKTLNGIKLSMSNSEMQLIDININGLTTQYPHPNSSLSETYDLNGTLLKITRSSSELDGYGNTKVSTEKIFDANDNLVRTGTNIVTYENRSDNGAWLIGLPVKSVSQTRDEATNSEYQNVSIAKFDSDGKPEYEILEPTESGTLGERSVRKAYTYDGFGNRKTSTITAGGIIDADGELQERINTTTFTDDGRFPQTVSNTLGHTVTTQFNELLGKPDWIKDANDIVKEFLYDGFGTVVRETKAHQNNGATRGRQIVLPKWCDDNPDTNCPTNAVYFIAAFDDEGEAPEIAYYNVNGKELRKQTYGFEGKIIVVETEYNENGQVARASQPYFQDEEVASWTSYEYDILGRQKSRNNAAGSNFSTIYDGFEVSTTNPGNDDTPAQTTRVINNIFGQPIESIDSDNNSTFYEYDGRGKLVKTTDALGNVATIDYDDIFGRKVAMNDPDLGAWTYEYDSLGNLVAQTDANGQRTTMEYDILNRLERRVDDIGGAKEQITSWEYSDTKGNGQIIGGLNKVISPNYERSVTYDDYSRVIEATSLVDGKTYTQRTGYLGTADKVDWIEYPSGLSVRNTYDDYGFPKTVEGITLDYDKYRQFQTASRELNDLQRQLEAYKDERLSETQLFALEEHERQVRRLGSALGEFYENFDGNPTKLAHEGEASRYTDLVDRVQQKITQHTNWLNIYQAQQDTHYNRIKDDLDRLELLPDLSAPYEEDYDDAKALHDGYAAKVTYYAGKLNEHGAVINHHLGIARDARIHVNNLIDSLYKPEQAVRYKIPDNMSMSGIEIMFGDLNCCTQHVINNFMKTQSADMIEHHMNQIENHLGVIERSFGHMENHQKIIDDNRYQWWYDHWEPRRKGEENKMAAAAAKINQFSNEANTLNARVTPDLDRINNWLAPIVQSHNNVILSFNDRARAYVIEISKRTGAYAKREDLKSENFLKPFKNHVEYIRCLRDQTTKSTGDCYKENLVHVLNDDGTVDTVKQNEARAKIESDALVDLNQFWSTNRFFCPVYYGYSCPSKYATQIKQLAKTLHVRQCARMTAKQKEQSSVTCDTALWNTTAKVVAGTNPYVFPYLESNVAEFSSNLNNYYGSLVAAHQGEVERLVTNATVDTYNEERDYNDIIKLGGDLWQASTPAPVADGEADPREFVLLNKGYVQDLVDEQMSSLEKEANRELRNHQYQIAQLINSGQDSSYDALYLAVQNKAEEVDRLYKEIDQAYALASDDDEFDDNAFNEAKKVYWQAEDINSKGQIKKAKYGNNTSTEWTYDQFGRINSHLTKNASNQTLLNNSYEYDAIGNLTQRIDYVEDLREEFSYDSLNRLVQNDLSGTGAEYITQLQANVVSYDYDELGNLTYKSDINGGGSNGHYTYGTTSSTRHAGPHAVTSITGLSDFTYDNNGNQLTGNGRTVVYSAFNKPTSIHKEGKHTEMWYGPERQMIKQRADTPRGKESTIYIGGLFEEISVLGGGTVNRHHIAVAGQAIAVVETAPDSLVATKESYLHKNHQGSVLAITDMDGNTAERRYYDAFGDIKSYIGQSSRQYALGLSYSTATDRGFTGHVTLVAAGVIHMGGRVYDATIGRFMSADPHIQSPLNSQSLNRYSYTLNNPLSFTDPSGYFFDSIFKSLKKLFDKIKKIIKAVLKVVKKVLKTIAKVVKKIGQFIKKYARVIVAVVVAVAIVYFTAGAGAGYGIGAAKGVAGLGTKVAAGALAGGASGLIMTGSLRGALEGAFFGAITAGFAAKVTAGAKIVTNAATGVTKAVLSVAQKVTLVTGHAVIGGIRAVVNGGKFITGALAAGLGKLATFGTNLLAGDTFNDKLIQGLAVATTGGAISALSGGSFELGFVTAGLAFAVNQVANRIGHNARVSRWRQQRAERFKMSDAVNRYNSGTGERVLMNLSDVELEPFDEGVLSNNIGGNVLATAGGDDYAVHGRFYVHVLSDSTVAAIPGLENTFDFEPHSFDTHAGAYTADSAGVIDLSIRNAATSLGAFYFGIEASGRPFAIEYQGEANVGGDGR